MRIHHLGLAVTDLTESIALYESLLGARLLRRAENTDEGLKAAFLDAGGTELELLQPTDASSAVGKFMARRGPGFHHVAYAVQDIEAKLAEVTEAGFQLIDSTPRIGLHGSRIAFVHPKSVGGLLIEFVEE